MAMNVLSRANEPRLLMWLAWFAAFVAVGCGERQTVTSSPVAPQRAALETGVDGPDGPILLHEYSGNALDVTGHGHHGIVSGDPRFRPSILGDALVLDGADDYVVVPADPALQPEAVSVEVYFRPQAPLGDSAGFVPLVVKMPHGGNFWNTVDGYDLWYQDSGGGGRLGFGIGTENGRVRLNAGLELALNDNRTHHIVGTFGGSELRLYLNGTLIAQRPHEGTIAYLGGPVWIGGHIAHSYYGSGWHMAEGAVDEFALYGYEMSEDEIRLRARRAERNPGVGRRSQGQ